MNGVIDLEDKNPPKPYRFILFQTGLGDRVWKMRAKGQSVKELEDWALLNTHPQETWIIAEVLQGQNT